MEVRCGCQAAFSGGAHPFKLRGPGGNSAERGGAVDGEKFTDPGTKLPAKAGTELILKKSRPCRKARFEENKGWPWPSCIREVLLIHHFTDPFQGR